MTKKDFKMRMLWLGLTTDQLIVMLNQSRSTEIDKSQISKAVGGDSSVEWVRRLNTDIDVLLRKLIQERREKLQREMMDDLRIDASKAGDIRLIVPVDTGYPVLINGQLITVWYPGTRKGV